MLAIFDTAKFYSALGAAKRRRGVSWRFIARAAGVSASTITRMRHGRQPSLDGMASLACWLGLPVGNFIKLARRPQRLRAGA